MLADFRFCRRCPACLGLGGLETGIKGGGLNDLVCPSILWWTVAKPGEQDRTWLNNGKVTGSEPDWAGSLARRNSTRACNDARDTVLNHMSSPLRRSVFLGYLQG